MNETDKPKTTSIRFEPYDIQTNYEEVKALHEKGMPVEEAIKHLKIKSKFRPL